MCELLTAEECAAIEDRYNKIKDRKWYLEREASGYCGCQAAEGDSPHESPGDCPEWEWDYSANVEGPFTIEMGDYVGLDDDSADFIANAPKDVSRLMADREWFRELCRRVSLDDEDRQDLLEEISAALEATQ